MKSKLQRIFLQMVIAGSLVLTTGNMEEGAQAESVETPAFSNPAQAQKAENISAATAKEPSEEDIAVLEDAEQKALELEKAETELVEAREKLDELIDTGAPQEEIDKAEKAVDEAQKDYDSAEAEYDEAKALADATMADLAGVPVSEIYEKRKTMGWGQICHFYGIPNSTVGLGKQKQKGFKNRHRNPAGTTYRGTMIEVQAMTQRNLKTGWAKGHGFTEDNAFSGKGKSYGGNKFSKVSSSVSSGKGVGKPDKTGKGSKGGNSRGGKSGDKGNNGNKGGKSGDKGNNGNKGGKSGNNGGKGAKK